MGRFILAQVSGLAQVAVAAFLIAAPQVVLAHETQQKTADPGFRPQSEHAAAFLASLESATIAVYPTLVRRATRTAHSFASQEQIVELLNGQQIARAAAAPKRIDLGRLVDGSQWELFLNDMRQIGDSLQRGHADAHYHLFMEFLLPVSDQTIFGIECYVLDSDGENAFSFLLNSHHRVFVEARLTAEDDTEAARARLFEKATLLGMSSLTAQINAAKADAETS
jgi:hypothetical protein